MRVSGGCSGYRLSMDRPFFPEPEQSDPRPGRRRETTWQFMHRSTWSRASEVRAFYNAALAALPANFSEEDVFVRLATLSRWRREGDRLVASIKRRDFGDAVEFVQRIVAPADEQNHHADVAIHWDTVTLTLWTHASGGLTERDFRSAGEIERILAAGER